MPIWLSVQCDHFVVNICIFIQYYTHIFTTQQKSMVFFFHLMNINNNFNKYKLEITAKIHLAERIVDKKPDEMLYLNSVFYGQ